MQHILRYAAVIAALINLSLAAYAQDIIITTDARKIEAKISEVSKSEIRYKEADNPDGPTFVLGTEDISSIIYANGKVVFYNQPSAAPAPAPTPSAEEHPSASQPEVDESLADIVLLSGQTIRAQIISMQSDRVVYTADGARSTLPAAEIATITLIHNGQVRVYNAQSQREPRRRETAKPEQTPKSTSTNELPEVQQAGRIYRDNSHYLHNNVYISKKEVERILQRENSVAYERWKRADGMLIGGAVCTGIGGGMVIGGLAWLMTGNSAAVIGIECSALVPLGIGLGLTLGASAHYNKAIDIYNSRYDQAAIELRWRVAPNELGVAVAF